MKLFPGNNELGEEIDTDPILLVLDNSRSTYNALLYIVGKMKDDESLSHNVRSYVVNVAREDLRKTGERVQALALSEALRQMNQYYVDEADEMERYWLAVTNHYLTKWREENS